MQLQDEYQVKLDAFCGPLDLLLYLIRRAEVEIHDVPIAEITDQYLHLLQEVENIDIEAAGEFLVMAATLMEIKSRTLMPPEESPEGEDGESADGIEAAALAAGQTADPRFELVRQLLEYQRYRMASEELDERRRAFMRQFPAQPYHQDKRDDVAEHRELELEDANVFDLYEVYERIIASIDFARLGDHRIEMDDTPAAVYQEQLLEQLRRAEGGRLSLQTIFEGRQRVHRIGLFLATLELVRLRKILVSQEDLLSEIGVELEEEEKGIKAKKKEKGIKDEEKGIKASREEED